jgi:hypothetical protein
VLFLHLVATSDIQIRLHKERFNVINEHLRRIEVEIAELESKIAQNPNDTELLAEVCDCNLHCLLCVGHKSSDPLTSFSTSTIYF